MLIKWKKCLSTWTKEYSTKTTVTHNNASDYRANGLLSDYVVWTVGLMDYYRTISCGVSDQWTNGPELSLGLLKSDDWRSIFRVFIFRAKLRLQSSSQLLNHASDHSRSFGGSMWPSSGCCKNWALMLSQCDDREYHLFVMIFLSFLMRYWLHLIVGTYT